MKKFLSHSLSHLVVISAICMSITNLSADWTNSNSRPSSSHCHCDNRSDRDTAGKRDTRWSARKHHNSTRNNNQRAEKYASRRQLPARTYDYDSVV